jgi:hypothetical protein
LRGLVLGDLGDTPAPVRGLLRRPRGLTADDHLQTQEASFAVVAPVGGLLGLTGVPAAPGQLRRVLVPLVCDTAAVVLLVIAAISPPHRESLRSVR